MSSETEADRMELIEREVVVFDKFANQLSNALSDKFSVPSGLGIARLSCDGVVIHGYEIVVTAL